MKLECRWIVLWIAIVVGSIQSNAAAIAVLGTSGPCWGSAYALTGSNYSPGQLHCDENCTSCSQVIITTTSGDGLVCVCDGDTPTRCCQVVLLAPGDVSIATGSCKFPPEGFCASQQSSCHKLEEYIDEHNRKTTASCLPTGGG